MCILHGKNGLRVRRITNEFSAILQQYEFYITHIEIMHNFRERNEQIVTIAIFRVTNI